MKCKICQTQTLKKFQTKLLNKYQVNYYECPSCKCIQTEQPYWLNEAYDSAIADLDVGYATRNIFFSEITASIINKYYPKKGHFLDYGGGYGLFVRMMRDKGYDFYRQDLYCENIFARHFDLKDLPPSTRFDLVTAFEVFEHIENPVEEIGKIFNYSDAILFSTELHKGSIKDVKDWWYFMPETGQHISFYSKETLRMIANKFGCHVYTNGKNLHLLTKKKYILNHVRLISYWHFFMDILLNKNFQNKKSLIKHDFKTIQHKITMHV